MSVFDTAAKSMVRIFGADAWYTRSGEPAEKVRVEIRKDLKVIDSETGLARYVKVASVVASDFPYDSPLKGDTIEIDDTTWTVERIIEDDGTVLMIEVRT